MESLNILEITRNDQSIVLVLLSLATFRVYLEVIGFDFARLPVTRLLSQNNKGEQLKRFHRVGLYFSLGYIIFFAPPLLV